RNSVLSLACRHMPQGLGYTSYRRRNRIIAPLVEMTLMTETPLHWLTISELAQRIRHGALSPIELTEHLLSRLAALDGTLHAFKLVARERALAQAQTAELALKAGQDVSPLHGIPYAAKDLLTAKGFPTTAASHLLENNIAAADAMVIRRLTQAGMVLLGKTHTVQ